jgi:hypothetical protein
LSERGGGRGRRRRGRVSWRRGRTCPGRGKRVIMGWPTWPSSPTRKCPSISTGRFATVMPHFTRRGNIDVEKNTKKRPISSFTEIATGKFLTFLTTNLSYVGGTEVYI